MSNQNTEAVRACFEQASRGNFAALGAILTPTSSCTVPTRCGAPTGSLAWSRVTEARFPTWS